MTTVLLVIHLLLAIALIGVVLLQRSEGGGLGIGGGGGGGGGMSGFMTGRGTANLLTRTTAIIAAGFMATSIVLAILAGGNDAPSSIVDQSGPAALAPTTQTTPTQEAPAAPAEPSVPLR
jgi:preprotein translocase subunit SecG